ncbi:MAG: hypothetical protein ACYDDS_10750 [Candidatus Sulfotelmatobacter sp.]
MPSRILAQSSVLARVRISAVVFLGILLTSCLVGTVSAATPGGIPWQVGDVVVCYGGGNCNVLRIHGTSVQLLDTLSDGLLGSTGGVALNNSLHVVATDDKGGGSSKVVVYSIASINPFIGTPLPHNVISTFDASSGISPSAAAIAVNSGGHLFVGNSSTGGASIVELDAHGTPVAGSVFTFPATNDPCATTTLGALDIDANAASIYVTAKDGVIRKVSLPLSSASCSQFANFGSGVTLYGVKDIPAGALSGNCDGTACPSDETVLVVARGFTDPDGGESEGNGLDPDAVNICTNSTGQPLVSCALLLDTNGNPGLTSPLWQAGTQYFALGAPILDPFLHQQTVVSAGTSGTDEPAFSKLGEPKPVIDNAVIWTDKLQPLWATSTPYTVTVLPNTPYIVDTNNNLETVTVAGTSGPTQPAWPASGNTIDGLVWTDQGAWQAGHIFSPGAAVGDAAGHPHTVLTAGTSGSSLPLWNDGGGVTIDNAVTWTNQGPVVPYSTAHAYALSTLIVAGGHAQQAVEPGTSGGSTPNFSTSGGRTIDNAVTWTDQGQEFWHPSFAFAAGAVIVDPAGHVQQVATAGTSGTTQPIFNDAGSTTTDNTVVWTDEGALSWTANFNYAGTSAANTYVVDGANHVQQATIAGVSGPAAPTFNDGGMTLDASVTWTDQGQRFWYPNFAFAASSIIVDTAGHVQQVITAGTSGPTQPTFNDAGGPTTDGLQWTDQGVPSSWTATTAYALSAVILDTAGHVQQVITAGTSGSSQPSFNDSGSTTPDGTVVWQDRGLPGTWTASMVYALNAVITANSHVQQATSAGTSGGSAPVFSTSGGTVNDNTVIWTDQGLLTGNAQFTWQTTNPYTLNSQIIDPANHVQLVTTAGTSGGSQPTFNDGGMVIDGLVWMDIGPIVTWTASTPFPLGTLSVDTNSFLEKVTTAGTSTTPSAPAWNMTVGGNTIDGLQWTDQGVSVWAAGHPYFTLGGLISDAATHAQKVTEAGTSGASTPTFNDAGGTTIDNAVTWTESHPMWAASHSYVAGHSDTLILDGHNHVQLVNTSGISGPNAPPFTSGHPAAGQTIDGLQWSNQATPLTSVVARYPVTGVDTLQSLALDPLVASCTGNSCSTLPLPTRKTANFWLGDSASGTFYKLNFASGTPITLTPGCPSGCGIQSLVVYGAEGANQPGLASLVSNLTLNTGNSFTASAQFEQNSITSTLSNNGGGSPPATPISLYASLVDQTSCFNDPPEGNLPCRATVAADTSKAIVWKLDFPLNGTAGLPLTETLNSSFGPPGVFNVDNSTDVFVDEQFDDTTFVGTDPGTRSISVHSLHEVPVTVSQGTAQCTYSSPLQNGIYKTNRNTLNFIFTCPGLTQTQFRGMHPVLSLVKKNPPQSPQFIPLSGTNGKGPYRFDSSSNFWTFQWNLNGATAGTYEGTTFDSSGVQSFTVTFSLK